MGDDFEIADFKSNQIAPCHIALSLRHRASQPL